MTNIKLNENVLMRFVDLNYEKVVEGIKRFDSASKLAENYMKNCEDPMESAKSLIRWPFFRQNIAKKVLSVS